LDKVDQGVALFALDAAGTITEWEGALGFAAEATVGQSIFALYHDDPQSLNQVRRALAGEAVTFSKCEGGVLVELRLAPQRDGAGKVTGLIGVATDITERTRAEQACVRATPGRPSSSMPSRT
jgi:PAS domain S-box-containing protein